MIGKGRVDHYGIIAKDIKGVEKRTISIPKSKNRFNITGVLLDAGSVINGLSLVMDDGKEINLWSGNRYPHFITVTENNRFLTTLNMWSRSDFYDKDLSCLILGFSTDYYRSNQQVKKIFYTSTLFLGGLPKKLMPEKITEELKINRINFQNKINYARLFPH